MLTLITKEKEHIKVDPKVIVKAKMLTDMYTGDDDTVIPVADIRTEVLNLTIQWLDHHKEIPDDQEPVIESPLKSSNFSETGISEFDTKFIEDMPLDVLIEVTLAANYFDVDYLIQLCTAKIACEMKGKTTEEIREIFKIENDFTAEENKQLVAEQKLIGNRHN